MKKKIFITFALATIAVLQVMAQSGTIEGRVYDKDTNEPLPFTNIIINGTNIGSTSDLEGNFKFTGVEPGFIRLKATSVGYEKTITEEFQVTNAQTVNIDIAMKKNFHRIGGSCSRC